MSQDVTLPAVIPNMTGALDNLTQAVGVPREILPPAEQIQQAWDQLPRLLNDIPAEYRNEHHARMCIAVAAGLFDSAINYAWNAVIMRLRDRVRSFGIGAVHTFTGDQFDEEALVDLKDAELIELCLRLNLITEDGYFFLDQCRDIRNNFSSAHPAIGVIDDIEFSSFVNRCTRYAFTDTTDPRGIDGTEFIGAITSSRFSESQTSEWVQRMRQTHEAQRALLFGTIHGIYCDPGSSQDSRLNAMNIAMALSAELTPSIISLVVNRHSDYAAHGDEQRQAASRMFFEGLGILSQVLTDAEKHASFSVAAKKLVSVHQAFDNFYNEPPFAERILALTKQMPIPQTAQDEVVDAVLTCAAGNPYGVSHAAKTTYHEIIQNFTPREVRLMLQAHARQTTLTSRLRAYPAVKSRFIELVALLDPQSVSEADRPLYDEWMSGRGPRGL